MSWMWETETLETREQATTMAKPSGPSEGNLCCSKAPHRRAQTLRLEGRRQSHQPPPLGVPDSAKHGLAACKDKRRPTACATKHLHILQLLKKYLTKHLQHVLRKALSSKQTMNRKVRYQKLT